MSRPRQLGAAGVVAKTFVDSKLTPLIVLFAIAGGLFATWMLPREEEPQIAVPMIDVFVEMPGASAREVEERVSGPMERLLWEIPGVEYVYSTSNAGRAMVVARFLVGTPEDEAVVRLNQKLAANFDRIPPGASIPLVKPRSIDDVPVLALTLSSERYDDYELRRTAAQLADPIRQVVDVAAVELIGGQARRITVEVDPARLAAFGVTTSEVAERIAVANRAADAGTIEQGARLTVLEAGSRLRSVAEVESTVIAAPEGRPVRVGDVARVFDGGAEAESYVRFASKADPGFRPAVTIAVSKRRGANAIHVADRVLAKVEALRGELLPSEIALTVTRNYGETAKQKSDELLGHMLTAVVAVSILIWLTLGFRESWIVFLAIPTTLAPTLAFFYLYGYTLNRITLFALIFSIGILVDDAIVVVENVARHARMPENHGRPLAQVAVEAVSEVGNPSILATFTIIAAVLPMAFVRGLMGPYMEPIPIGASAAVTISTFVAFVVTPWAAIRFLKPSGENAPEYVEDWTTRLYRRVMTPLLHRPPVRWAFLLSIVALLLGSTALVGIGFVEVKMLPFDNKSEFQIIVNMPEGTPLEETARATRRLAEAASEEPEVLDVQTYSGAAGPYNFNGLVRHYFLRRAPHQGDVQVNLVAKEERAAQSHDVARRVRERIEPLAREMGARIEVAEVPPGPPVLQTLVAEIYGPSVEGRRQAAAETLQILEATEGVVDVDWSVAELQAKTRFVVDRTKAARHGVSVEQIARELQAAASGLRAGLLEDEDEKEDVPIEVRLGRRDRASADRLAAVRVRAADGALIPLSELTRLEEGFEDQPILHKNLLPVTYVTADVAGAIESPVYAMLQVQEPIGNIAVEGQAGLEQFTASQPFSDETYSLKWDGEWYVTYEVFRDLGLAFAAVMVLIYVLLVGWFRSFATPLVIMSAIPFSLVGILPAHGLFGAFFTATSMIGFIAGAGIVIRNSIILVDFVELRRREGMALDEAVVDAGAVRFRPMMLTASSLIVGAAVMVFDPIFQGLAISLMAGETASLLLSRMTVPIVYYLAERRNDS